MEREEIAIHIHESFDEKSKKKIADAEWREAHV